MPIKKEDKPSRIHNTKTLKQRIVDATSIAVCLCILFFSLTGLLNDESKKQSTTINSNESKERASENPADYPVITDSGTLSKEEILFRMLNTVDSFQTAQGTYSFQDTENQSNDYTVSYAIEMKDGQYKSYSKEYSDSKDTKIEVADSNQLALTWIYPSKKEYFVYGIGPSIKGEPIQINEVVGKTGAGNQTYISRERPFIGVAFHSLFHYEFVNSFLVANQNWEIENQNTDLFGYKTVIIKGSINRGNTKSFRIWVNRPTGIIIKMETYDSKGNVIQSLQTDNIKLNEPVDKNLFKANIPDDYTKISKSQVRR
jgi:hypothetical protein